MSMLTPQHVYRKELDKIIREEIDRLMENISLGHLNDHAEYKYLAGKLAGLRLALDYLDEAERIYREKVL